MADQSFAKSLQKRIVIYSAAGMLVVGLAVALAGILPLAVQLRQAQEKNLLVDLRRQTRAVEQYATRARTASSLRFARGRLRDQIDAFAQGRLPLEEFRRNIGEALREAIGASTNTISIYLLDPQTNVIVQQGQAIPRELWVVPDAAAQGPMLSGPKAVGGQYCIVSAAPLVSSQGERIGSAMALYRLESLHAVVNDYADLGKTGETIVGDLANKDLPVFFPFRPLRAGLADDEKKRSAVRQALGYAQQGRTGMLLPDQSAAPSIVLAYGPVEGAPWGVVIKMDRDEFFAPVNRRLASIGGITFGLVLLGAAGMILILRPLAGRVLLHTDELESEIYEKTAALNTELGERVRAEKSLRDSEALYHSLVDTLPINILRKDLAGRVTYGNRGYCEMMGKPFSELKGRTDFDLFPRELAEKFSRDDDKVVNTGLMFEDIEENRRPDGQVIHVHVLKAPVRDARGEIVGTQVIFWDVTARKQAELALGLANAELARSNQELEQFAYVASHDLQEPLRMITSYTQLIARRYDDKLDGDARDFMGFAVNGALRMQRLIHDLLLYSRVGTRGKAPEPVNSGEALEAALDNLKLALEEAGAEVEHDTLPVVKADPVQLPQLFQNLVGNAIKFRGGEKPRIQVSATLAGGDVDPSHPKPKEYHFSVRDNGIGIEPQYFEKIFVIFQRLHTVEQYPGTGIGLAVCKKIIERHGGRIWVESRPGAGATFHFTLPAAE